MEATPTDPRRRRIRRRTWNAGDALRTRKATIRMTPAMSNRLASVQGLCHAHGEQETLAKLWEDVAFPAIERFVRKYALRAKAARAARKRAKR